MTEKRFTTVELPKPNRWGIWHDGAYLSTYQVCILLNEYVDVKKENEQLRKSNKFLSDMGDVIDIMDENKQLKQFIKELTTKGTGRIDLASGYSYNVSAVLTDYRGDFE